MGGLAGRWHRPKPGKATSMRHQCDIKAPSKPVDSQAVATLMRPQSHPHATPKPPSCDPNATSKPPSSQMKARETGGGPQVRWEGRCGSFLGGRTGCCVRPYVRGPCQVPVPSDTSNCFLVTYAIEHRANATAKSCNPLDRFQARERFFCIYLLHRRAIAL